MIKSLLFLDGKPFNFIDSGHLHIVEHVTIYVSSILRPQTIWMLLLTPQRWSVIGGSRMRVLVEAASSERGLGEIIFPTTMIHSLTLGMLTPQRERRE